MQLSKHIHENRNENYTVIVGELNIDLAGNTIKLCEGESYTIEAGTLHRLKNDNADNMPSIYKMYLASKDYIWDGDTLVKKYGKDSTYDITAESWDYQLIQTALVPLMEDHLMVRHLIIL